jgi:hypothetical protein
VGSWNSSVPSLLTSAAGLTEFLERGQVAPPHDSPELHTLGLVDLAVIILDEDPMRRPIGPRRAGRA